MASPGAPQGNGESAFSFSLVQGQRILKNRKQPVEKGARLFVFENVFFDARFQTALGSKLLDEIWIRQKPNIEDDVRVMRNSVFVSKRSQKHRHPARA